MLDNLDNCFMKEREGSKINPRLRADVHGSIGWVEGRVNDGLEIFQSCLRRRINMNSVLY